MPRAYQNLRKASTPEAAAPPPPPAPLVKAPNAPPTIAQAMPLDPDPLVPWPAPLLSQGRFVPLQPEQPPASLPAFASHRLVLCAPGQPAMWVWNVAAWRLSQALAARDRAIQAPGGRRAGRQYRSGIPLRRKRLRRWWAAPQVVQPPAPPGVRRPQEWAALRSADAAQAGAEDAWQQQELVQEAMEQRLPEGQAGYLLGQGQDVQQWQRQQQQQQRLLQEGVQPVAIGARCQRLRLYRQRVLTVLGRALTSREDADWQVWSRGEYAEGGLPLFCASRTSDMGKQLHERHGCKWAAQGVGRLKRENGLLPTTDLFSTTLTCSLGGTGLFACGPGISCLQAGSCSPLNLCTGPRWYSRSSRKYEAKNHCKAIPSAFTTPNAGHAPDRMQALPTTCPPPQHSCLVTYRSPLH